MNPVLLSRREALARLSLLLGGALVGGDAWLRGETVPGKSGDLDFSAADLALMDEIGETIIPATDTPGAKAAGIGAFMAMMVRDCYDQAHHAVFRAGLDAVNRLARERHGADFTACPPAQRTALLNELDREARRHQARKPAVAHHFHLLRQLTILGYFTSEIGATQALRYAEVPGGFDGNAPYKKGDRAWFVPADRWL